MILKLKLAKKILTVVVMAVCLGSLLSCSLFPNPFRESTSQQDNTIDSEGVETSESAEVSGDELEQLLKNENFLKTFNNFYYPDSKVKQARQIENNEKLFFILMDADDDFKTIENFYKNKKAQSIWNRSIIFETSDRDIEDDFLSSDDDSNTKSSKFTYYNQEKDKVVNVLIKNLEEDRTEIMIICWELK
jgi:uncharacterized membrane protein